MIQKLETIEEFEVIAGDAQDLHFSVCDQFNSAISLSNMTATFKLCLYGLTEQVVLQKTGQVYDNNKVKFMLLSSDTINYRGKYTYQVILTDRKDNRVYIPAQGIINFYPQIGV